MNYTDFTKDKGDLVIEPATREWSRVNSPESAMKEIVKESFEQPFGDDLDFPMLYSNQQKLSNSMQNDNLSLASRITDAERILQQHSEIIADSIDVDVESDLSLTIAFNIKDVKAQAGLKL